MAETLHPTFFVAALSATVNPKRIAKAKVTLGGFSSGTVSVLHRYQLESLLAAQSDRRDASYPEGVSRQDADYVLNYFRRTGRSSNYCARQRHYFFPLPSWRASPFKCQASNKQEVDP